MNPSPDRRFDYAGNCFGKLGTGSGPDSPLSLGTLTGIGCNAGVIVCIVKRTDHHLTGSACLTLFVVVPDLFGSADHLRSWMRVGRTPIPSDDAEIGMAPVPGASGVSVRIKVLKRFN